MTDETPSLADFLLPGLIHAFGNDANKIRLLAEYGASDEGLDLVAVCEDIVEQVDRGLVETVLYARAVLGAARDGAEGERGIGGGPGDSEAPPVLSLDRALFTALRILRVSCNAQSVHLVVDPIPAAFVAVYPTAVFLELATGALAYCRHASPGVSRERRLCISFAEDPASGQLEIRTAADDGEPLTVICLGLSADNAPRRD